MAADDPWRLVPGPQDDPERLILAAGDIVAGGSALDRDAYVPPPL
jgi:hypothetical protein